MIEHPRLCWTCFWCSTTCNAGIFYQLRACERVKIEAETRQSAETPQQKNMARYCDIISCFGLIYMTLVHISFIFIHISLKLCQNSSGNVLKTIISEVSVCLFWMAEFKPFQINHNKTEVTQTKPAKCEKTSRHREP